MSYPLYKETNYPRSCSLTRDEADLIIGGHYTGVDVHEADTHQFLRFVSREEIMDKWMQGKIVSFGKNGRGEIKPSAKLHPARNVIFYVARW